MSDLSTGVLDLFCGGGGFSQGFAEAGYDIVAGIDIDDDALATFEANHDATAINADLSTADPRDVTKKYSIDSDEIDVVLGGPPCQGFSAAGTNTEDDERNDLVREYFEWVDYLEPEVFVLENVPGLLSHDDGKMIDWIIGRADYLDYSVDYDIHNASECGVPQDRERLIIIGANDGVPEIEPDAGTRRTVADVLDGTIPDDAPNHERADHSERVIEKYHNTAPGESVHGHHHQYRLEWDALAHTVTASNRDWHPEEPRSLTIREQARLQTFPDNYHFHGVKHKQQKQVGNAIPVRLAREIGEQIADGGAGDGVEINGSFVTKDINGSGPYLYRVSPEGNWNYLGRADGKRAYEVRAADD